MAGALDSGSGWRCGRENVDTDEGERRDRNVAQDDCDLAGAGDGDRGAIHAAHGASSGGVYDKALRLGERGVKDRIIGACVR